MGKKTQDPEEALMAHASFMETRRRFLVANRPLDYQAMVDDGSIEQHLEDCAAACVEQIESYISQGVAAGQARQWAIRVALLDSEPD